MECVEFEVVDANVANGSTHEWTWAWIQNHAAAFAFELRFILGRLVDKIKKGHEPFKAY